jgi:uncharacterized membrane-anchored protein YhcB (DUF1043 family)
MNNIPPENINNAITTANQNRNNRNTTDTRRRRRTPEQIIINSIAKERAWQARDLQNLERRLEKEQARYDRQEEKIRMKRDRAIALLEEATREYERVHPIIYNRLMIVQEEIAEERERITSIFTRRIAEKEQELERIRAIPRRRRGGKTKRRVLKDKSRRHTRR